MSCTLIVPNERLVLYVANACSVHMWYLKQVSQLVKSGLVYLFLINNYRIVEVSTLYKICLQQWHNIPNKYKGSGRRYFVSKFINIVKCCKLTANELRLKGTHCCYRELLVRENSDNATTFVLILHLFSNDVIIFRSILVYDTYFSNLFNVHCC